MSRPRHIDRDPFTVPPFAWSPKVGRSFVKEAPKRASKLKPSLWSRIAARLMGKP